MSIEGTIVVGLFVIFVLEILFVIYIKEICEYAKKLQYEYNLRTSNIQTSNRQYSYNSRRYPTIIEDFTYNVKKMVNRW